MGQQKEHLPPLGVDVSKTKRSWKTRFGRVWAVELGADVLAFLAAGGWLAAAEPGSAAGLPRGAASTDAALPALDMAMLCWQQEEH